MGDWSEYFEDYPGGYFGEAPNTYPVDAETQAWRRRRALAAKKQAEHRAKIQRLVARHTPPTVGAVCRALGGAGDARPETMDGLGRWINKHFRKDLSITALHRLAGKLERDRYVAIDGDGVRYLSPL